MLQTISGIASGFPWCELTATGSRSSLKSLLWRLSPDFHIFPDLCSRKLTSLTSPCQRSLHKEVQTLIANPRASFFLCVFAADRLAPVWRDIRNNVKRLCPSCSFSVNHSIIIILLFFIIILQPQAARKPEDCNGDKTLSDYKTKSFPPVHRR